MLGQQVQKENDKLSYSAFAAVGRSIFRSTIDGPSKFPTAEIRLGGSVTFKIAKQFDVLTRLDFGVKLKREMYNKPGQPYTVTGPFMTLDEMAGKSHYFFEVPLFVQYRFPHPKLNVALGINYRKFFNDYESGVFNSFNAKNEVGAIGRFAYRLNSKFSIGVEYFIAFTKIYGVTGTYDGEEYTMTTRNEFAQITLDYKVNFRKGN